METCIFCKIVKGEINAEIIYENSHALAFLDAIPRAKGHALVVPMRHFENIRAMDAAEIQPFFEIVQKVVNMIKDSLKPDGFTLGMNYDRASGQEVDHMHFHILPRWYGDGGHSIQSVVANSPKEDLKLIAEKIRQAK